jgi:hypothetical protein
MAHLKCINRENEWIDCPLNLSAFAAACFDPTPFLDPDVGDQFDFVPERSGVIIFLRPDGSATYIDACPNLRNRIKSLYSGIEPRVQTTDVFAFEQNPSPNERRVELVKEHLRVFKRIPQSRASA